MTVSRLGIAATFIAIVVSAFFQCRSQNLERASRGLHLFPKLRFVLDRGEPVVPDPVAMQASFQILDDAYVPHGGQPAAAPIVFWLGTPNTFSVKTVLLNDGEAEAVQLSVEHAYVLFDLKRQRPAVLVESMEKGPPALEKDYRRPGRDWLYRPVLSARDKIIKESVFPMSEVNPPGDFIDLYWYRAHYYRHDDPTEFTVEELWGFSTGKIRTKADLEALPEHSGMRVELERVLGEHDL